MDYLIVRVLCSFICGCLLSQAGSLIQLGTRNILSSPSTMGIDGLVVFWVLVFHSLSLWFGVDHSWGIWAGVPIFILIGLSFRTLVGKLPSYERVILLGITFNLAVGALFSLWQFLFLAFNLPFPVELWFGHFRFAELSQLVLLVVTEVAMLVGIFSFKKEIYLFTLGRSISKNFKLDEKKLFGFIFVAISISTFVVIHSFGAFSFLGLVFPLIARRLWFASLDLKGELLWGALFNGFCFMLIDFCCYEFPVYGAEVPVGLIVTGVGAVSLIFILWNSTDRELLAKPKK